MDNNQIIDNWLPLQSNTDVVQKYIKKLGVSEIVQVYDIYSFDFEDLLLIPQPIIGALFTFPCTKNIYEHHKQFESENNDTIINKNLFYMKQTAKNACGTIGLLHILLNVFQDQDYLFTSDSFIRYFYEASQNLTPRERADLLKNDKILNTLHKEAVHQGTDPVNEGTKVEYHFIAFVQKDGFLYELDGRKKEPTNFGLCDQEMFLQQVSQCCQEHYINQAPGEVGFNLMVLSLGQ